MTVNGNLSTPVGLPDVSSKNLNRCSLCFELLFPLSFLQAEIPKSGPEVEAGKCFAFHLVHIGHRADNRVFVVVVLLFIMLLADFDMPFDLKSSISSVLDCRVRGRQHKTARQALTTVYNRAGIRPSEESIVIIDRFSKIISDETTS